MKTAPAVFFILKLRSILENPLVEVRVIMIRIYRLDGKVGVVEVLLNRQFIDTGMKQVYHSCIAQTVQLHFHRKF